MLTWLTSQSQPNYTDTLGTLFDKYIPDVLEFVRPILSTSGLAKAETRGSSVSMSERVSHSQVEPQELMLSEVHLIKTCYQILEVGQYHIKHMFMCVCLPYTLSKITLAFAYKHF